MQARLTSSTIKKVEPALKPFEVVDSELKGFLLRVQPSGRMTFYYSYRTKAGQRQRIKIGVFGPSLTVQQARDTATRLAGSVVEGVDVQQQKAAIRRQATEAKLRTLSAFIEHHYEPWVLANRKTGQATLERVKACFSKWMSLSIADFSVHRIDVWRTEQLKEGRKPSTVNRNIVALRGIISKAVEWGMVDQHPLQKLKPLAIDKSPKVRFLSIDEEMRLYAALTERDKSQKKARERGNQHRIERGYPLLPSLNDQTYADRLTPLVVLSLKTGVRRGEAFDLTWEDVDLKSRVITIRGDTAKSGNTRHIPLSPSAFEALQAWAEQAKKLTDSENLTGRVFASDDGGRLDNVKTSWSALLSAAKIEAFRWHDMRHDFASKLVMKGVPLNTVRELCGHADNNTTLRYAHLAPDHKADAVALIG